MEAVLFDLDGTLTPRRQSIEHFASLFAADHADALGPIEVDALAEFLVACDHGGYNPNRARDQIAGLPWQRPPSPDALEDYWQTRFPDACLPQPGLHDVLDALREAGLRIGIVTNGGVPAQTRKLELLGVLEKAHDVVISDAVACKKPDPRIFELAARGVGAAPEACWFVGDHPENDVLGPTRFGMRGVWIQAPDHHLPWPEDEAPAAHRVAHFPELLAVFGLA